MTGARKMTRDKDYRPPFLKASGAFRKRFDFVIRRRFAEISRSHGLGDCSASESILDFVLLAARKSCR
ncbi:hypothetical protein OF829_12595 [Sphingomonas sp. LB-2]|uniref:hypothetical protein n=1 Tax=Sphingomonas caeni TaxID=2984949 RepID=UPI00223267B2|nr:hypothetical protein [Sphingomonas caeni]MCW3848081.1 hypothetical protein [Sphingomonas caeni]